MGKYWYGVGAKYLGNPYWVSFGWYCLSILVVYLLAKNWLIVYLWALNPIIVEQIGQTMLDLPMVVFFLFHVLFLFKFGKDKSYKWLLWAGVFLGLMAGTKPAYFVPMIGLVDWWWIYRKDKKQVAKKCLWLLGWVIGGYVLAYTCYFIKHPNPIPWIRLHEKVIAFQKGNGGSHDVLNIFKTIFLEKYKGFWVGGKVMLVTGWSILLPIGTILLLNNLRETKKWLVKNDQMVYWSLVGIGYILMNLTIDFWPRYLVLLVPILLVVVGYLGRNKPVFLVILLASYLPWLRYNFWPEKQTTLDSWKSEIDGGNYRDAYRLLDSKTRLKISENDWLRYWQSNKVDNLTKEMVKENNQWKIDLK